MTIIIKSLADYIKAIDSVAQSQALAAAKWQKKHKKPIPQPLIADIHDCWKQLSDAEQKFVLQTNDKSPTITATAQKAFDKAGIVWSHLGARVTEKLVYGVSVRIFLAKE